MMLPHDATRVARVSAVHRCTGCGAWLAPPTVPCVVCATLTAAHRP